MEHFLRINFYIISESSDEFRRIKNKERNHIMWSWLLKKINDVFVIVSESSDESSRLINNGRNHILWSWQFFLYSLTLFVKFCFSQFILCYSEIMQLVLHFILTSLGFRFPIASKTKLKIPKSDFFSKNEIPKSEGFFVIKIPKYTHDFFQNFIP
jgi:hypothetical protein